MTHAQRGGCEKTWSGSRWKDKAGKNSPLTKALNHRAGDGTAARLDVYLLNKEVLKSGKYVSHSHLPARVELKRSRCSR